jgi:transcriptional regulator with XRE-family HTH domain
MNKIFILHFFYTVMNFYCIFVKKTMETKNLQIGNKIKSKRIEKGIKQEALANDLNISQASLSRIENGKEEVGINTLLKLSEILKTPINYFTTDPVNINQQHASFENSNGVYIAQQYENNDRIEEYKNLNKQKDFVIDTLQIEIKNLKDKVDRKDKKIEELKAKT